VALLQLTPELSAVLLHLVDVVFQAQWKVLLMLSELPVANIVRPKPVMWQLIVAMAGLLLLLAPKGIPGRYLGILFILPLFLVNRVKPSDGEVTLTILDVGQGLSVVVQTAEHSLVFDTGARFSDKFDMGRNVVVPFLNYQHIIALDKLIISHADNDHIGGAEAVLDSIPTQQVLSSVPEKLTFVDAIDCIAGYIWQWDEVGFYILSPPVQQFNDENNNSCVLKVDTKHGSILLTGDIESSAEYYLTKHAPEQLKADVLIAPHHGSKTSSSLAFLENINPSIVLIPADMPNRFAFPHAEVLARYNQLRIKHLVTGRTGAITVKFANDHVELEAYRDRHSHYWNR